LKKRYLDTNLLRIAFRHFPLEDIHPRARPASEAAACANSYGQFWPMHDLLFRSPQALGDAAIVEHARGLKLDPLVLARCREAEGPELVSRDLAQGQALGVYSTPSFFIGRPLDGENIRVVSTVTGAQPLKQFEASIQAVIDGASR
jgi:protein-disulfide isomerase